MLFSGLLLRRVGPADKQARTHICPPTSPLSLQVLASDGLWDKVAPQEAATLAHNAWSRVATLSRSNSGAGPSGGSGSGSLKEGGPASSLGTSASAGEPCGSSRTASGTLLPPALSSITSPSLTRALSAASSGQADQLTDGTFGPHTPPLPGRTCTACKAARIAAAAMSRCARSRRSRDDTTVVVVNLQQACQCAHSWATVSAGAAGGDEEKTGITPRGSMSLDSAGSGAPASAIPAAATAAAAAAAAVSAVAVSAAGVAGAGAGTKEELGSITPQPMLPSAMTFPSVSEETAVAAVAAAASAVAAAQAAPGFDSVGDDHHHQQQPSKPLTFPSVAERRSAFAQQQPPVFASVDEASACADDAAAVGDRQTAEHPQAEPLVGDVVAGRPSRTSRALARAGSSRSQQRGLTGHYINVDVDEDQEEEGEEAGARDARLVAQLEGCRPASLDEMEGGFGALAVSSEAAAAARVEAEITRVASSGAHDAMASLSPFAVAGASGDQGVSGRLSPALEPPSGVSSAAPSSPASSSAVAFRSSGAVGGAGVSGGGKAGTSDPLGTLTERLSLEAAIAASGSGEQCLVLGSGSGEHSDW